MYPEERQQAIAEQVMAQGRASVADLAQAYDVTTETVRRDLAVLDRAGVLRTLRDFAAANELKVDWKSVEAAPNEALLFFGRPLHGSACCWCTSDTHPFWSEAMFQRAVGAGLPPAHAVDLVDPEARKHVVRPGRAVAIGDGRAVHEERVGGGRCGEGDEHHRHRRAARLQRDRSLGASMGGRGV